MKNQLTEIEFTSFCKNYAPNILRLYNRSADITIETNQGYINFHSKCNGSELLYAYITNPNTKEVIDKLKTHC